MLNRIIILLLSCLLLNCKQDIKISKDIRYKQIEGQSLSCKMNVDWTKPGHNKGDLFYRINCGNMDYNIEVKSILYSTRKINCLICDSISENHFRCDNSPKYNRLINVTSEDKLLKNSNNCYFTYKTKFNTQYIYLDSTEKCIHSADSICKSAFY